MVQSDLSTLSIVAQNDNIIQSEVDDEVVALCIESANCYGFNAVGSRIWHLLAAPVRVGDLCGTLQTEFDVDPATCERDVLGLLREALAEGMIKVAPGAGLAGGAKARA